MWHAQALIMSARPRMIEHVTAHIMAEPWRDYLFNRRPLCHRCFCQHAQWHTAVVGTETRTVFPTVSLVARGLLENAICVCWHNRLKH